MKFLDFLPTEESISQYHVSDQHSYKRGSLVDKNAWNSEIPDFKYQPECQSF